MPDDPLIRRKRNIYMHGRRTSINIENYLWENLERIAASEGQSVDEICARIEETLQEGQTLAAMIRYVTHEVAREENAHRYRSGGGRSATGSRDKGGEPPEMHEDSAPFGNPDASPFARVIARLMES